ncbi:hypothetical protein [Vibrio sp. ABG19]|uniref:hypothetical protein n=1 Tax=Vibrio sp. ABG19 TaxID=2817385 RepID=UPI00249DC063|nr:hypothetical protein [Vibrio sp. ABG19]WGY45246.1 hypothetical protein J0X00_06015 [Vibrio sp. ABG19]
MFTTQRQAEQALKYRLQNCRKEVYPFTEQAKIKARAAIRSGELSRKQICEAYRMTYRQLQQALTMEQK